jgi:ankyrin repeat protein
LEVLRHCLPPSLRYILPELPETLDETYEQILRSIDNDNREHAHRLFQCLTVAIRPLRVEELAEVLVVDFDAAARRRRIPKVHPEWRWEDQHEAILSTCSSLIAIVDDGNSQVVQFSHFSVKEFLTSKRLTDPPRDVSRYHVTLGPAHAILAQACLAVLLRLDDRFNWLEVDDFPLAEYAAKYWDDHIRFEKVSSSIRDTIQYFFDEDKPHWKAWHRVLGDYQRLYASADDCPVPLVYAAFCGLYDIAEHLIAKHPQHVNPVVRTAATPLGVALGRRELRIAQLLYDHGADVNIRSDSKWTLLHAATVQSEARTNTVEWLLNHGAKVNAQGKDDTTALHLAVRRGDMDVVQMLMGHKAKTNIRDAEGRTALLQAVNMEHLEIAQKLIEHKANINARYAKGRTLLHLVVNDGHLDIARILIDHKANVNARDKKSKTPLHLAAKSGHGGIVMMLITNKANINARDCHRRTPLHVAVLKGHLEVVRTLLRHNVKISARDSSGRTPLHMAIDCPDAEGRLEIMRLLLGPIADTNPRVHERSTTSHKLSDLRGRYEQCSRSSLKRRGNIDAKDKMGRTALDVASEKGYDEVAELLRTHGATMSTEYDNVWYVSKEFPSC